MFMDDDGDCVQCALHALPCTLCAGCAFSGCSAAEFTDSVLENGKAGKLQALSPICES